MFKILLHYQEYSLHCIVLGSVSHFLPTAVHCLAYDAYRIVSGSADSTICVWKVCSNANWLAQTLRGHSGAVRCLELLPLPPALASPTSPTVTTPSPSVWEPPEALLISGSVDTSLKLWRLSSTFEWSRITCIGTLQGHFDTVRCVQVISFYFSCLCFGVKDSLFSSKLD